MCIEVWQVDRPKGRKPIWACRVKDDVAIIFDSNAVSIRLLSHDAAYWLARLVKGIGGVLLPLEWTGDLADDCSAVWGRFGAHAEHLNGPRRGGVWYCSVSDINGNRYFHTADREDVQPRSGTAARWLCEVVISAAELDFVEAYSASPEQG